VARSRRRRPFRPASPFAPRTLALVAAIALSVMCAAVPRAGAGEPMELQLEVSINGQPTGMIGGFTLLPGGGLAATPSELRELGVKADDVQAGPGGLVALESLPGVTVRYDEARQAIDIAGVGFDPIMRIGIFPEHAVFIALAILLATLAAGLYPAWKVGRIEPVESIKVV